MSSAVAEAPEPAVRKILHPQDAGILKGFGADLDDPQLVAEYFDFRDSYGRPGQIDQANLHLLRVHQIRRQKKGKKA